MNILDYCQPGEGVSPDVRLANFAGLVAMGHETYARLPEPSACRFAAGTVEFEVPEGYQQTGGIAFPASFRWQADGAHLCRLRVFPDLVAPRLPPGVSDSLWVLTVDMSPNGQAGGDAVWEGVALEMPRRYAGTEAFEAAAGTATGGSPVLPRWLALGGGSVLGGLRFVNWAGTAPGTVTVRDAHFSGMAGDMVAIGAGIQFERPHVFDGVLVESFGQGMSLGHGRFEMQGLYSRSYAPDHLAPELGAKFVGHGIYGHSSTFFDAVDSRFERRAYAHPATEAPLMSLRQHSSDRPEQQESRLLRCVVEGDVIHEKAFLFDDCRLDIDGLRSDGPARLLRCDGRLANWSLASHESYADLRTVADVAVVLRGGAVLAVLCGGERLRAGIEAGGHLVIRGGTISGAAPPGRAVFTFEGAGGRLDLWRGVRVEAATVLGLRGGATDVVLKAGRDVELAGDFAGALCLVEHDAVTGSVQAVGHVRAEGFTKLVEAPQWAVGVPAEAALEAWTGGA